MADRDPWLLLRRWWHEAKLVADGYFADRVPRMAAALSYYTIFSLAPLLVIAVALVGLVFGDDAVRAHLTTQFRNLLGEEGGGAVQTMIEHARRTDAGVLATIIGLGTLFIGATGVFGELQDSLNTIWKVRTRAGRTFRTLVRSRLLSFAMVFGIGFLLLVSLVLSAALSAVGTWINGSSEHAISRTAETMVSFAAIGLLFAASFKLLPDVSVRWRDVWPGAGLASLLFVAGKYLIGLYLGRSALGSAYGSMGALAVLLLWIYASSQVFLIGALFTRAHALAGGTPLQPTGDAEWIPGHEPQVEAKVFGGAVDTTPQAAGHPAAAH